MLMDIVSSIADHYASKGTKEVNILGEPYQKIGKTIIFVNHKRVADRLATGLNSMGFNAASMSSDISPRQRHRLMKDFTMGYFDILVSTDVLSRGMNIPRVEYVINFDHPQHFSKQEYVHRVGRCGRVGNYGRSITFFEPRKDYSAASSLIMGCEASGQEVPQFLWDCLNYNDNYQRDDYSRANKYFGNDRPIRNSTRNNYHAGSDSGMNSNNYSSSDENARFSNSGNDQRYKY